MRGRHRVTPQAFDKLFIGAITSALLGIVGGVTEVDGGGVASSGGSADALDSAPLEASLDASLDAFKLSRW